MLRITTKDTVDRLDRIFCRLGYPRTITLDNARQFIGIEFSAYCKLKGITLNNTIPYWPQQNGEVERQNHSLLKRLKISHALNRNWRTDLRQYLQMYYTTPHTTTGKTPTELCFGRTIRGKIPSIHDVETAPPSTDYRDKDWAEKLTSKSKEDKRRRAHDSEIKIGDTVLLKDMHNTGKLNTPLINEQYKVIRKEGPRVTVESKESGRRYDRSSAHMKKIEVDSSDGEDFCGFPADKIDDQQHQDQQHHDQQHHYQQHHDQQHHDKQHHDQQPHDQLRIQQHDPPSQRL